MNKLKNLLIVASLSGCGTNPKSPDVSRVQAAVHECVVEVPCGVSDGLCKEPIVLKVSDQSQCPVFKQVD